MTFISQDLYWVEGSESYIILEAPNLYIYGGLVNDVLLIVETVRPPPKELVGPHKRYLLRSSIVILGLIDMPLCAVADTLILPLTIYEQIAGPREGGP
jgi:hypothetical protein